ncbi:hypothetical protein PGB90_003278 [Kerria lacca]
MTKKRKTIYESDITSSNAVLTSSGRPDHITISSANRVSTFRPDYISGSCSSQLPVSRADYTTASATTNVDSNSNSVSGSRYRKKSLSSKRSKKQRNTYSELQIPTVSDNGATRNRMAFYNRQLIVHSDNQSYSMAGEKVKPTEYFCPQTPKSYNATYDYDDMRTFPRYGYQEKDLI